MTRHTETTAPERIWAVRGLDGIISFNDYDNGEQSYVRADIFASVIADAERRGRKAGLVEAANLASMWFQFGSQGEPTGGYCTVEAHDPGGMVRYIKRDAILALRTLPAEPSDTAATVTAQDVGRVAAAMWKSEAVDSGAPVSVANERTLDAFEDQPPPLQAKWRKFANAAIIALLAGASK